MGVNVYITVTVVPYAKTNKLRVGRRGGKTVGLGEWGDKINACASRESNPGLNDGNVEFYH